MNNSNSQSGLAGLREACAALKRRLADRGRRQAFLFRVVRMKRFSMREVDEAVAYAAAGGQALHCHKIIVDYDKAPRCFVAAVERGEDIAHLYDQDRARLERTVRYLGVRVVVVERAGTPNQHVDLCGGPLRKAKGMCE